ncbi:hypothetical protein COCSUDRAFT_34554 [Coccomyxa subellipsoidea C-169]|uniref:Uncharacterized protein n=1 Tax=Coccomyxa subellipsoidea (strain C-169) TaxID=574566 RepID=I0YJ09_COCSC|nr:hypothetical protein COCSUDRAFT_34554 [Coccomyxa subellipsoidea C-169]EIE18378.1 hypothetical protein COCSUDRAFT_34554 [Coccomyxa subellipsoidea C-169]|eukprot:XP_005642922.1 hypothetical protein COCSUDRAFT_34554 [Coccomyxa subellipsoidea C-169]
MNRSERKSTLEKLNSLVTRRLPRVSFYFSAFGFPLLGSHSEHLLNALLTLSPQFPCTPDVSVPSEPLRKNACTGH